MDKCYTVFFRCKYTPDGSLLITASRDTRINIWDAYTGVQVATLLDNGGNPDPSPTSLFVLSTSYSRDVSCDFSCSAIASVSSDGSLAVWNPWSTEASFEKECSPSSGSKVSPGSDHMGNMQNVGFRQPLLSGYYHCQSCAN